MSASNLPQERSNLDLGSAAMSWREIIRTLMVLFKFRVVVLLLLSAVGGAFLGAGGWPGFVNVLLVFVTGFFAASGASALNQYWEQEQDKLMARTEKRPLVTGAFNKSDNRWVPLVAVAMIFVPSLAVAPIRPWLTFYLLLGAFIYVAIYTIWLKPRTLLNIVIGGAAGSAAVMSGGAAVGAEFDPGVITLALLVFLWTPSHFWSLAMLYRDDYKKAGTPMLPAYTSLRNASLWVMVHTVATIIAALLLILVPTLGWLYAIPAILISVDLFRRNVALIAEPEIARARKFFIASNLYLAVILAAIMVGVMIPL